LSSAKDDLKNQTTPIVPDVTIVQTNQLRQLEQNSDFSPGQTSNANYKKARFDENGRLSHYDGMEIIEVLEAEMATETTSPFNISNGHYAIVGQRRLMLGRGENNKKNTVEDFRDPKAHGTERTINVNYDYVLKFPDGIRLLRCSDGS